MFFGIIIVLALVLAVVSDSHHVGEVSEVAKGFLIDKMYSQLR